MKALFFSAVVFLTLLATAEAQVPARVLGFSLDPSGVTLVVASAGCTDKTDFSWWADGDTLYAVRFEADTCELAQPFGTRLSWGWAELGLTTEEGARQRVGNPVPAAPGDMSSTAVPIELVTLPEEDTPITVDDVIHGRVPGDALAVVAHVWRSDRDAALCDALTEQVYPPICHRPLLPVANPEVLDGFEHTRQERHLMWTERVFVRGHLSEGAFVIEGIEAL